MFTGIVEAAGEVVELHRDHGLIRWRVLSSLAPGLRPGQSVSHNGVCLTVEKVDDETHTVAIVAETLDRSALGNVVKGGIVNLERALRIGDYLDGHWVLGHVDSIGKCLGIKGEEEGERLFTFSFEPVHRSLLVDKGSVCIDGVSLTVIGPGEDSFSVTVVPFTYNNTSFSRLKAGDRVNIEFDIIGKYLNRILKK